MADRVKPLPVSSLEEMCPRKHEVTPDMLTPEERKMYAYEIEHNEPLPARVGNSSAYYTTIRPQLDKIGELIAQGKTHLTICKMLGINASSWYKYLAIYTKFRDTVDTHVAYKVYNVEAATAELAQGFSKTVKKPIKVRKEEIIDGKKVTKEVIEYVDEEVYIPPNAQAQQFVLKNLMPERYKDKVEVQQTVTIDVNGINGMSTEQLLKMMSDKQFSIDKDNAVDVEIVQNNEDKQD